MYFSAASATHYPLLVDRFKKVRLRIYSFLVHLENEENSTFERCLVFLKEFFFFFSFGENVYF